MFLKLGMNLFSMFCLSSTYYCRLFSSKNLTSRSFSFSLTTLKITIYDGVTLEVENKAIKELFFYIWLSAPVQLVNSWYYWNDPSNISSVVLPIFKISQRVHLAIAYSARTQSDHLDFSLKISPFFVKMYLLRDLKTKTTAPKLRNQTARIDAWSFIEWCRVWP